jgi:transcriptional regulator with XRE-family HTH domain
MVVLEKRFGNMVAARRRLLGITQEALATEAGISVDMISKIETGATGARFPNIEKIAAALQVDPAELFSADLGFQKSRGGIYAELTSDLARLSDEKLRKIKTVMKAIFE